MGTTTRHFLIKRCTQEVSEALAIEWCRDLGKDLLKDLKRSVGRVRWTERRQALQAALQSDDAPITELLRRHPQRNYHGEEGWLLRALLYQLAPSQYPHPKTTSLELLVTVTYAPDTMPNLKEHKAQRDLALRLLGLYDSNGEIAKALGEKLLQELPTLLPFFFVASLENKTQKSGSLHILTESRLVAGLSEGISVDSAAW